MISTYLRSLALCLSILGAAALGAARAHAGLTPWDSPVCADPVAVSLLFTVEYGGWEKCETMCKLAANHCRSSVNDAASCQRRDRTSYWKENTLAYCAPQSGQAKRDCTNSQKSALAGNKESIAGNRETGLANCEAYLDGCLPACIAP